MAEYRKVHTQIWADPWVAALNSEEKVVWFYLITNEKASVAGIYLIRTGVIAAETGLCIDTVDAIMQHFCCTKKIMWDEPVLWVRKMRGYQESKSPLVQTRIRRDIDLIPACKIKRLYVKCYGYSIDTVSPDEHHEKEREKEIEIENETEGKGTVPPTDPIIAETLATLRAIPNWASVKAEDVVRLQKLREEFPGVNMLATARDLEAYCLTKIIKKGDNPWGRYRNFVRIQSERNGERHAKTHSQQGSDPGSGRQDRGAETGREEDPRAKRQREYIAHLSRPAAGGEV